MLRGSLVACIYRAVTLLPSSQTDDNAAISLMSTDIEVIDTSLQMIHECWAAPIEASVGIWLLAEQIGAISVATVGIAISKSLSRFIRTFKVFELSTYIQKSAPLP